MGLYYISFPLIFRRRLHLVQIWVYCILINWIIINSVTIKHRPAFIYTAWEHSSGRRYLIQIKREEMS